jgi:hypothetical protein
LSKRSRNPWDFPAEVREFILSPVHGAKIIPPLGCSVPLVDAVLMHCPAGIVIPLANHTLQALDKVDFTLKIDRPISRVETVYQGKLDFQQQQDHIAFSLSLDASDYVKIYYQ